MESFVLADWFGLAGLSLGSAFLALWWARGHVAESPPQMTPDEGVSFLSYNDQIYARSDEAPDLSFWADLADHVRDDFPDFPESSDGVDPGDDITLTPARLGLYQQARIVHTGVTVRVELTPSSPSVRQGLIPDDIQHAPYPIWKTDPGGQMMWFNQSYAVLFEQLYDAAPSPTRILFATPAGGRTAGGSERVSISAPGRDNPLWFDVTTWERDGICTYYAQEADAQVHAETARRSVVQTLAKTFAQLAIGLAIFDKNRKLVLFNPAMMDLTNLRADYLSNRPDILSFFDQLRNSQVMPEPKSYSDWRARMNDLVSDASGGRFRETWTLPSGSVYRVTGRPHPDGAIAFLIEDITAEVTLTRRFRFELEQAQIILDRLDDAIAVFGRDGVLMHSNMAYRALWNSDPDSSFAEVTIHDACKLWAEQCDGQGIILSLSDFVSAKGERVDLHTQLPMRDGQFLDCEAVPILGGATMLRFRRGAVMPAVAQAR